MNLIAIPDGDHAFLMDCDECGPLGVVEQAVLHHAAYLHLLDHGIEPMIPNQCTCGYDYDHTTGHAKDHATCTRCEWTMSGLYADHSGHHHYLDTGHTWHLTMGQKA